MSNPQAERLTADAINLIRYYQEAVLSPAPADAVIDHMIDRLTDFAGHHSDGAVDGAAFRVAINRLVTQQRMTLAVGLERQRHARHKALEDAKRALCEWCAEGMEATPFPTDRWIHVVNDRPVACSARAIHALIVGELTS